MNDNYEINHSGILGMRWGQRNGPPYPLGTSENNKRSAFETKLAAMEKSAARRAVERQRIKEAKAKSDYAVEMARIRANKKARIEQVEKIESERYKTDSKSENIQNHSANTKPSERNQALEKDNIRALDRYRNVDVRTLSDIELSNAINRLRNEAIYADLVVKKPNPIIAFIKKAGQDAAKRVVTNIANRSADELSGHINKTLFSNNPAATQVTQKFVNDANRSAGEEFTQELLNRNQRTIDKHYSK